MSSELNPTIAKHVQWLRGKITASTYKTHDEQDPVMQKLLQMELKQRGINITMEQVLEIDRLKRSISQNLGDFWQRVLGDVPDWENLGIGHETGCDLINEKTKTVIELKNKWNTMNSSSRTAIIDKLVKQKEKGYTGIIGIINDKTVQGKVSTDKKSGITIASGAKLFELVCGYNAYEDVMKNFEEYWNQEEDAVDSLTRLMSKLKS